jgi:hypothetical protein
MSSALLKRVCAQIEKQVDFGDLCANLDGASPPNVLAELTKISRMPGSLGGLAMAAIHTARSPSKDCRPFFDPRLPRPHPLEFEWRFTRETNHEFLSTVLENSPGIQSILFLGAPTTALHAADTGVDLKLHLAMRPGDIVANAVSVAAPCLDPCYVWSEQKPVAVDAAIVDPPWYDAIAIPMLARAASLVRPGGIVCWVGPNNLTAPSAAEWFADLTAHAGGFGLTDVRPLEFTPRYDTPFFERRALVARGLLNVHPQWRTGMAWIARRAISTVYRLNAAGSAKNWEEFEIEGCRLRFDLSQSGPRQESPLAPFRVIRSTSSADPDRRGSTIWTSGNAASRSSDAASVWNERHSDFIARKLFRIARTERQDFLDQMRPMEVAESMPTIKKVVHRR